VRIHSTEPGQNNTQPAGYQEEKSMSRMDSQEEVKNDVENLFLQNIHLIIPKVVRQACASLGHYPDQAEIDDYVQEINELLLEDNRRVLRSFHHRSKPETYLYTIARRRIIHRLRRRSGIKKLDDMRPDSSIFIVQPDQEKKLLAKEMEAILWEAFSELTERERKLLSLWLQERSIEEIAKEMGVKKRSVSRRIIAVTEKLRRIIGLA